MEMEMGMDSLWPLHQHPPPPLPPSSGVPDAFSYYDYYPPFTAAVAVTTETDNPTPPAVSRSRASRSRAAVKKDRHSKICTAGGMRDRRMRLSLDVARRFFALQDKLGFDKASKTVQWLLDRSTAGINHLAASMSASMSLSDGDGSVLLDQDNNDHAMAMAADAETNKQPEQEHQTAKAKRRSAPAAPSPRKKSSNGGTPVLLPDKASRARARERARERTKERNRLRSQAPAPAPVPSPARQPVAPVPAAACRSNNYYEDGEQEPWELGVVVFAKPRIQY